MNWDLLPFEKTHLENYLATLYPEHVEVQDVQELKGELDEKPLKEFGYGTPLLIEFTYNGQEERVVLSTMSEDGFGHERRSDRARNLLMDHTTFNKLSQHVQSLDVGAFTTEGDLLSLGQTEEFFLLTNYNPGRLYAQDLQRIADSGELETRDQTRVLALADYLAEIHTLKQPDEILYRRRIRDLVGHGEGIMGMLDGYPAAFDLAPPARLEAIEKQCVTWRWRIKDKSHRLCQVHGDFHPFNIIFQQEEAFILLDRSRGEWGEPADDLTGMTINYILFSLRKHGRLTGPFLELFNLFWERYLTHMEDEEIFTIAQPFFAWRALVLASPVWYPSLSDSVREALFNFTGNILETDRLELERINDYLSQTPDV